MYKVLGKVRVRRNQKMREFQKVREFEETQRDEVTGDGEGWYRSKRDTKSRPLNLSLSWSIVIFVKAVSVE